MHWHVVGGANVVAYTNRAGERSRTRPFADVIGLRPNEELKEEMGTMIVELHTLRRQAQGGLVDWLAATELRVCKLKVGV